MHKRKDDISKIFFRMLLISKTEVTRKARISTNEMARIGKNEDVRVAVLAEIYVVLNHTTDDMMRI